MSVGDLPETNLSFYNSKTDSKHVSLSYFKITLITIFLLLNAIEKWLALRYKLICSLLSPKRLLCSAKRPADETLSISQANLHENRDKNFEDSSFPRI